MKPHQRQVPSHPRVKIYYLKNDPSNKSPPQNYTSPITAPSITCLSSFIQKQKKHLAIQSHENLWPNIDFQQPYDNQNDPIPTISFTQPNPVLRNTENLHHPKVYQQQVVVSDLNITKNPIRSNDFCLGSPNQKRFIKTTHEKYFPNHQNNQAFSKQFLCNIVKEWKTFSQRQKSYLKKSVLNKRKRSIDCQKSYKPQQIQQLKKNKFLMREHFNLFIQNQKEKSTKKKERSHTLLKAIFHRQDSSDLMVNKNDQAAQIYYKNLKISQTEVIPRARISSKTQSSDRRWSVNEKNPKTKYFRLLYGPEVKLVPRLFEEKIKIKNFDWTKLDQKNYESRKKNLNSHQLLQL